MYIPGGPSDRHLYENVLWSDGKAYVLVMHAHDCGQTAISGVVGQIIQPSLSDLWHILNTEKDQSSFLKVHGLGNWYNYGDSLKPKARISPELREICVRAFGLTEDQILDTLVVRKLGTLATDRLGVLGANPHHLVIDSIIHAPVLFI